MSGPLNPAVMWLTMRQLFVPQRLITAVIVSLFPLALAMLFEATGTRTDMDSGKFLITMYRELVIGTMLPLVTIVFGTLAFGDGVADGTIIYLLVKPEARWRVVLSKYVVATLASIVVMLPAVFLPWTRMNFETVPMDVPLAFAAAIFIGAAIYTAIFLAAGLASKRALVLGLIYVVIIEFMLSRNVAGVKSFSVREITLTALAKLGDGNRWIGPGEVTIETAWTMGSLIFAASLMFAWHKFQRYELAEKL